MARDPWTNQIDALGAIVRVLETDPKQQYKDVGTLSKYASGLGKCIEKCETDVKNKKGNGGTSDSLTACAPGDAGVDANMQACLDKNTEKLEKKVGATKYASVVGIIDSAYAGAANATWNKPACSGILPGWVAQWRLCRRSRELLGSSFETSTTSGEPGGFETQIRERASVPSTGALFCSR